MTAPETFTEASKHLEDQPLGLWFGQNRAHDWLELSL